MFSTPGVFSASGGHQEYIKEVFLVYQEMFKHPRDIMIHVGDIISILEMFSTLGFSNNSKSFID